MKIRIALNSDFVSRRIRGAAYGILLLLTFFVPQFAKTQDQLNAAKTAQAATLPVVALEQKQTGASSVESGEAYVVIAPISSADDAALLKNTPDAEEIYVDADPIPSENTSLTMPEASAETSATARETVILYEPLIETAIQTAAVASVVTATPARKTVIFSEPLIEPSTQTIAAAYTATGDAGQVAALTTQAVISATAAPARETVIFSEPPVEEAKQMAESAAAPPVQVAALTPAILPAAQSAPVSSVNYTGEYLTADFVNMPLVDFFRTIAEIGGINVILDPAISGNVNLKVVKMPWDELFEAVLKNHGLDKKIEGSHVRVALKKTLQEEAKQEEDLKKASMMAGDLIPRVKRLNYAKAIELKEILTDQKSARGTVTVDVRTNSLLLTDLPDYIEKQLKLIDSLDTPEPQVEIETRIVSATRNFARDIGVQFGFVQGNNQRVTVGGSNPNYLQPGPASRPSSDTGTNSNSPGVSTGGSDSGGNLNVNLPSLLPFGGIGLAIGNIVDTFMLDTAITAGESKGWAKLISQPKVVVQNNSPAIINDGMRFPVAITSDNTVTIQYYDAALTLTATPQITYDGNILLDLKATNNKADFGYTATGGVPTIRTSETSTRIMVSDGGTTMMGMILVEDESTNEERVPGLGSLPLLGNLFRRTGSIRDAREIMFFVTPRIIR